MTSKILILHDSADFGGHERMLLNLLPAVAEDRAFDISFCFPATGNKLSEQLADLCPQVRQIRWPYTKRRGEPYLRHLRWRYRDRVRRLAKSEAPDVVLLAQGRIEHLAVPMSALPRSTRVVSYIPMAHRLGEMKRGGLLGDGVRRALYRRPDRFIVPCEAVAEQVRAAGGIAPISVVQNVVDPPPPTDPVEARRMLGLRPDGNIALFIGRLDPVQKGLDQLLTAIARGDHALAHWTFLFVGDGPGAAMIEQAAVSGRTDVQAVRWTDRPDLFLSAADAVLLPSRWEGLPLVMLEAMKYGRPILASDIDVYRSYLPADSIVDFETASLAESLDRITSPASRAVFATHSRQRLGPVTIDDARRRFADAIYESLAA